jgi:hypothetical protein
VQRHQKLCLKVVIKKITDKENSSPWFKGKVQYFQLTHTEKTSAAVLVFRPGIGKVDMENFHRGSGKAPDEFLCPAVDNEDIMQIPVVYFIDRFLASFAFTIYTDKQMVSFPFPVIGYEMTVAAPYLNFDR